MANKKRSTTKKRKSTKKSKTSKLNHEIIGLIILGIGIFCIVSVYTQSAGIAGEFINNTLKGLFGVFSYVLPFLLGITGVLVIMSYKKKSNKIKITLTVLLVVISVCFIHLLYNKHYNTVGIGEYILSSWEAGLSLKGSGAFISPLVYVIFKFLGLYGSYILYSVVFIANILLLTNLSLEKMGKKLAGGVKEISNKISIEKKQKDKRAFEEEVIKIEDNINHTQDNIQEVKQSLNDDIESTEKEYIPYQYNHNEQKQVVNDDKQEIETKNDILQDEKKDENENISNQINSKLDKENGEYTFPPLSLLKNQVYSYNSTYQEKKFKSNAKLLEDTLMSFGVDAKVIQVSRGPSITRYELQPAPGVKVSKIVNLSDDIALNLAASGVRIEAPIPGKAAIGVEVPNQNIKTVYLREVLESLAFRSNSSNVAFVLGKDIAGKNIVADLTDMPHMLIAGATGSGKSVCINALIISILYKSRPEDVKMILIDPKVVELNHFNGIPHLLIPVVTDPKKASGALNWAVQEMVDRYNKFAEKGVRDIKGYNAAVEDDHLPKIVVIIDELADLMMVAPGEVEDAICRLAQMARAAGIHLVIATQRPSVDVITGVIKANIPSRVAFAVSSHADSRTILDMGGAEKLLGRGDMLFYPVGSNKPLRVQGAFVSDKEVEAVVKFIKEQGEEPEYNMEVLEETAVNKDAVSNVSDELLPQAIELAVDLGQVSISMLQRKLRVGYARAARLVDEMEIRGIVSGFEGSKPRKVLISKEEYEQLNDE